MKQFRWLAAGACLVLLVILGAWQLTPAPQLEGGTATAPAAEATRPPATFAAKTGGALTGSNSIAAVAVPALAEVKSASIEQPAIAAFENWARAFVQADAPQRGTLLATGEKLAEARRGEMLRLIQANPQQAVERMLPYALRKALPEHIAGIIEQPVRGRGDLAVLGAFPSADSPRDFKAVRRELTVNRKKYVPHVAGQRRLNRTEKGIAVYGVAVDDQLAMSANPLQVVSEAEARDLVVAGDAGADPVCSVSGEVSSTFGDQVFALLGNQVFGFCQQSHAIRFNGQLLAAEGQVLAGGGPGGYPTNTPPDNLSRTQGRKTVLFIRVKFPDDPTEPITESEAYNLMNGVNAFFAASSYNNLTVVATVTPLVTVTHPKRWYGASGGEYQLLVDAREAARLAGFDYRDYDLDAIRHVNVPGFSWGGLAFVGGRGTWLQSSSVGVAAHEFGHNLGLLHANFWQTGGAAGPPNPNDPQPNFPIDSTSLVLREDINAPGDTSTLPDNPPGDVEYGDIFDTMGSAGAGRFQFSIFPKAVLRWLPLRFIQGVAQSTTNRLYAYDGTSLVSGRTYGMVVEKDFQRSYWISHRQLWVNNPWHSSGVEMHWSSWAGSAGTAQLLDTTPGSPRGREDAPIVLGRTFADPQNCMYITPVAKGGQIPEQWIDVVVHLGDDPNNLPPVVNAVADQTTIPVGGTVNFSATATDPNGDSVAYYWNFGDNFTVSDNAPTVSHTFNAAGKYAVRCEVSDLKGGFASTHIIITVGEPDVYVMSGQVIDDAGNPIAGVRVHNGRLGGEYRVGISDSQGFYAIGNVAPGSYTNAAFLYGARTQPLFNNPVLIAGGDAGFLDHLVLKVPHVSIRAVADADEAGPSSGSFEITRTGNTDHDLPVYYVVSGTAVPNGQYQELAPTLVTIPAGAASVPLEVQPLQDGMHTGPSSVTVTLRLATNEVKITSVVTNINNTNVVVQRTNTITFPGWELLTVNGQQMWFQTGPQYILGKAEATVVIQDMDEPTELPTVSISAIDSVASESGSDTATFVVSRTGSIEEDLLVGYSAVTPTVPGLPIATTDDFTLIPAGKLLIPAGVRQTIISVVATDDLFVEGNELLALAIEPSDAYNVGTGFASCEILDDDLPLITVTATDNIAAEPNANRGTFTFTRAGDLSGNLVVSYLISGTATSGVDFVTMPGQITIPAGQLSASVDVIPLDDGVRESNETVVAFISESPAYNIGTPGTAIVTIQDNELPTVTIAATDANAAEPNDTGTFTLTRTGSTTASLTVFLQVGGSAIEQADYGSIGTNITFAAGAATAAIVVSPVNENYREIEENVIVRIGSGPNYNVGSPDTAVISISDDDGSSLPAVGFMMRSLPVLESADYALIPIGISAEPTRERSPATVEWRITGGSAQNGVDYSLMQTGYVDFFWRGPLADAIIVPIFNNDFVQTSPRTLLLTLYDPQLIVTNQVVQNGQTNNVIAPTPTNAFLGAHRTFTLHILDDDTNIVRVAAPVALAREAGSVPGYFEITREGPTNRALIVTYAITGTASSPTDYAPIPNQITIPAGTNAVRIYVNPVDDAVEEYVETVKLRLIGCVGGHIGFPETATINIQDNDGTVQFTLPNYRVLESDGAISVPVQRSGDTNVVSTVDFVVTGITASNDVDFVVTNGTLVFLPGEVAKSVDVTIIDDTMVEPNETISLVLSNPTGGVQLGGQATATITILNDDTEFVFASASFRGNENSGFGEVNILRTGDVGDGDTVVFSASPAAASTADFVPTNTVVTFLPGETNQIVRVQFLDDDLFEGDEGIDFALSEPSEGTAVGEQGTGTLVIVDDECRIDFAVAGFSVREYSNFVSLIVRRVGGTVNPVRVDFTTAEVTATNGLDYVGDPGSVTFAGDRYEADTNGTGVTFFVPGDAVRILEIPIIDDVLGEGHERFTVTLSNAVALVLNVFSNSTVLGSNVTATVTILDNELPGNVDYEFTSGANGPVRSVAVAPRGGLVEFAGRVFLGGDFTQVDGVALNHIARLLPSGALDTSFNPGAGADGVVHAVAAQPDGKVILGGEFTTVDSSNRIGIARLNADGRVDTGFDVGSAGVNGIVRAISLQTNGQVLIGGDFTDVNGVLRSRIARLHSNGTLDTNFNATVDGPVHAIAVQPDGRIVIGGAFAQVNGSARARLARLNANGALDPGFAIGTGCNDVVNAVAVQLTGHVLAGGAFTTFNSTPAPYLVRLHGNGAKDNTFNVAGPGADGPVNAIGIAANGKIVIGGQFTNYNGIARAHFARLTSSGSLDSFFDIGSGANAQVRTLVVQPDTAIVIGGDFTVVNELPRNYVARIHGDERYELLGVEFASATFAVAEDGLAATITVLRAGNTNEAFTVEFLTADGTATAPGDYATTNGVLTFAPGEMSKTFEVRVFDDTAIEGNETVQLLLTNGTPNVNFDGLVAATLVIIDSAKTVSFEADSFVVNEGGTNARVTLVRGGSLAGEVTITFSTRNITAASGYDYVGMTSTVTFTNQQTTATVLVPVLEDIEPEFTETVLLMLSGPGSGYAVAPSNSVLKIIDNDLGPGFPDTTFDPGAGASRFVRALALQPDGRVVVGGAFTNFANSNLNFVARLHTNGWVDTNFNPGTGPNALVSSIGVSPDGKIALGGSFSNYNGAAFNRVVRLTTNGAPDPLFTQQMNFDAAVQAVAAQPDGRAIVGGGFRTPVASIARVRINASLDLQFDPSGGADGPVHAVALQPDGKALVGGAFTNIAGGTHPRIARLGTNGILDLTFAPAVITNGSVFAVAPAPGGKVVIGGSFRFVNGVFRSGIARLNGDGSLDTSFHPGAGVTGTVYTVSVLTNGSVFIGGDFTTVNGTNRNRYALLRESGALDQIFDSTIGADNTVFASVITPDQKVIIGGDFMHVGGIQRRGVAKLVMAELSTIRITRPRIVSNAASLSMNSIAGRAYVLEGSSDLGYWVGLSTNVATGATLDFTDPNVSTNGQRFYRARRFGP